jgi:hypothetical protein
LLCFVRSGCLWTIATVTRKLSVSLCVFVHFRERNHQYSDAVIGISAQQCSVCWIIIYASFAPIAFSTNSPSVAGLSATIIPAFRRFDFAFSVAFAPATMAPAWLSRRPGGAVRTMKPAVGFQRPFFHGRSIRLLLLLLPEPHRFHRSHDH